MRSLNRATATFWGLFLVAALALCGCEDPKKRLPDKGTKAGGDPHLKGGDLVYSDDFNRAQVGEAYSSPADHWKIADGWVHAKGARNEGLWLKEKLPQRARVEFDARSESPDGDIKIEIFAAAPKHQGGYIVIFGGWKNQLNVIARLDEHGKDRKEAVKPMVERGKTYHFAVIKAGDTLTWYVDNELVLSYRDPSPLSGRYFGFNDWDTPVYFDNLRVYDLN